MAFLNDLRYFFYLAINWNASIAYHVLKHEKRGEAKYGIDTTGYDNLTSLEKKGIDISSAKMYMPASYDLLEEIFKEAEVPGKKHFIDIGCGKGRALCVAAFQGVKKLTGIEISFSLCKAAEGNLAKIKSNYPDLTYKIINNDAYYYEIPHDADCIFMFNPFDESVLAQVMENIRKSFLAYPRQIHLIYLSLLYKNLVLEYGFKETYQKTIKYYLQGSVFVMED